MKVKAIVKEWFTQSVKVFYTIKITDNHAIPRKYRKGNYIFAIEYTDREWYWYVVLKPTNDKKMYCLVEQIHFNPRLKRIPYVIESHISKMSKTTRSEAV